jgi:hypothetical protein
MYNTAQPVLLSALFDTQSASLQFRGHNEARLLITISHNNSVSIDAAELTGNATSDRYIVEDGDVFTIIARRINERHVVASGSLRSAASLVSRMLICCLFLASHRTWFSTKQRVPSTSLIS